MNLSRQTVTLENLSHAELLNVLRFIDKHTGYFSKSLGNSIVTHVRYDSYNNKLRFTVNLPASWVPAWSAAQVLDAVRSGMVE